MVRRNRRKSKLVPRSLSPELQLSWDDDSGFASSFDDVELSMLNTPMLQNIVNPQGVQTRRMSLLYANSLKRGKLEFEQVLLQLMKYLDQKTLLKCRSVNKLWNHSSTFCLSRRQNTVSIDNSRALALSEITKKSFNFPFSKFKFQTKLTIKIEQCFKIFGTWVRDLQIHSWDRSKISFKDVFRMLKYLPNVNNLMLVNIEFPKLETGKEMPDHASLTAPPPLINKSVMTLNFTGWFLGGPSRKIDMRPLNMHCQQYIADVFNALPQVRRLELDILRSSVIQNFIVGIGRFANLECLSIRSLEEKDLTYLFRCCSDLPKLRSLTFGEVYLNFHGATLLDVLNAFAKRLNHLDIRVHNTRAMELITFPQMNCLHSLHLDTVYNVDGAFETAPRLMAIPNQIPFPNLKKCVLSRGVLQGLILTKFKAPRVTELVLKMAAAPGMVRFYADVGDDVIVCLPLIFPALKKLKVIDIPLDSLRSLFENVRQVEHLEICRGARYGTKFSMDLNPVLTGLESPALHAKMLASYCMNPIVPQEKKRIALEFILDCSQSSIRCMTNLKVLIIGDSYYINSSTVDFALLQMQRLDVLIISEDTVNFGNEALKKLNEHHKFVEVKQCPGSAAKRTVSSQLRTKMPDLIRL